MERSSALTSLAVLVGIAGAGAVTLYLGLVRLLAPELASTLAIGLAVGGAVYVERRWWRVSRQSAADALLYGAATAAGWAAALFLRQWLLA